MALARVKHILDLWGVDDPKVCSPGKITGNVSISISAEII